MGDWSVGEGLLQAQEVPTWRSVAASTHSPGQLCHLLWLFWFRILGVSPESMLGAPCICEAMTWLDSLLPWPRDESPGIEIYWGFLAQDHWYPGGCLTVRKVCDEAG